MRALVQRVASARVTVDGSPTGEIGRGLLVLLGITHSDDRPTADWMADKLLGLRIFSDEEGRMNRSVEEVEGGILVVSQFTLYGDARKGRRPSFVDAARPEHAIPLYEHFVESLRRGRCPVETGRFGAMMQVELVNDGPVTLLLERGPEPHNG
jgi:D-aminoacyl-tRNA deacylase